MWKNFNTLQRPEDVQYRKAFMPLLPINQQLQSYVELGRDFLSIKNAYVTHIKLILTYLEIIKSPRL